MEPLRPIDSTDPIPADYQFLFESTPGLFIVVLPDAPKFTILAASNAYWRISNRTREESIGRSFFDVFAPRDPFQKATLDNIRSSFEQVLRLKQQHRMETQRFDVFPPDAAERRLEEHYWSSTNSPLLGGDGNVRYIFRSVEDVTDRTLAEIAKRDVEERLVFALEGGGGVGTWDWDIPNDLVYCHPQFAEFFSIEPARGASGAPLAEFIASIHDGDKPRVGADIQLVLATGGSFAADYRVVQRDGSVRWIHARGRCHLDQDGRPLRFPGVAYDITDRREGEEALRESQERLRAIYDGTYEYIGLTSPDGILLEVNRAALEFAGSTREEVIDRPFWEGPWFQSTAGAAEIVKEGIARAAKGEFVRFEATLRRPSGDCLTFDLSFHPVRDAQGEVVLIVPEGREITERTRAEEQLLKSNDELKRVNRELEEFAYVASHDLQEPLRMVNIYTELALEELRTPAEPLTTYAGYVRQGVDRMNVLIQDLLTFSRAVHAEAPVAGSADLAVALEDALSVLQSRIVEAKPVIQVDALPTVRGEAKQMSHVFQNLLANALKYRREGVELEIRITATREAGMWIVCVQDNGIGFDQKYAQRIFGLFKRLHEGYPGTGLGLAICKRIVERCGGQIWAEGVSGTGATFCFSLLAADPAGTEQPVD